MAVEANSPFDLVYDSLWEMIEANTRIEELVRVRNRIKFDDSQGLKKNISDADTPELAIMPESTVGNFNVNSHQTVVIENYTIFLSTGEWNLEKYFNTLRWELLRSMSSWKRYLARLAWPVDTEQFFVKRFNLVDMAQGADQRDRNRGLQGWAAGLSVEVEMWFFNKDLELEIKE